MSYEILQAIDKVKSKIDDNAQGVAELSDRVLRLEQQKTSSGEPVQSAGSLGQQVVKAFGESAELFAKTGNIRLEIKAAGDPITTASGRTVASAGVGGPDVGMLGFQNALQTRPRGGTTAVEYSRYTGKQGAAAVQVAEGDSKAAIRPDHTIITQQAITIAGFTKMSEQALLDSRELATVVNTTLLREVYKKLDEVLVLGIAAPVFTGFAPLATAYTSLVYTALVDAISEGVSIMQINGFQPDVVALSPVDWLAVNVAKATDGQYLSGSYLAPLPQELRGLRRVISSSVTAGKALLLDSAHSELGIVDNFQIEIGHDGNDFTKNLKTIRGEMRVLPVFRTVGSAMLITPKAP